MYGASVFLSQSRLMCIPTGQPEESAMSGEKTNRAQVNPTLTVAATASECKRFAPRALSEDKPGNNPCDPAGFDKKRFEPN